MSILMKVAAGIGAVLLIACLLCMTIVALYTPKKHKGGDGEEVWLGIWDESIEDV